jgi:hypothetical protein
MVTERASANPGVGGCQTTNCVGWWTGDWGLCGLVLVLLLLLAAGADAAGGAAEQGGRVSVAFRRWKQPHQRPSSLGRRQ